MAHLREIVRPKCWCGKSATHQVVNNQNAPQGDYCERHAVQRRREVQALEEQAERLSSSSCESGVSRLP